DYSPPLVTAEDEHSSCSSARSVSRRVSTKQSPHFKAFYKHYPVQLTLDTGAETSMIKSSLARSIGAPITKSSQQALQADGLTPLAVVGETRPLLSRADKHLALDALVVDDLDVDVLAGTPFLIANDISVRPAKCQVRIQDSEVIHYEHRSDPTTASHAVRRAQCYTLRAPSSTTVLWPGDYVELDVPPDLGEDHVLALQPRTDTPVRKHTKATSIWPEPQILEAVGTKVRLVNSSQEPKLIGRHEHHSQILPTEETSSFTPTPSLPCLPQPVKPKSSLPFSSSVSIDPDNILPEDLRVRFRQLLQTYDRIFDPDITGYNGAAGPILASVNIGPVQPPQRKGRVPQYSRNQLVELQAKFDELEQAQVFRRPEDLGITVEYLNPSFLVKKPSGGHRLVTAFADVARYSKPQPSLMPDSMANNDSLNYLNVTIDVGRVKNKNKNPIAEKAVRELEEELIRQEPGSRPVSAVGLALATARLNSRLRLPGLSSRELWTQRNQFTHEQLPLSDYDLILGKHEQRSTNHASSEKSKNPRGFLPNTPSLQVGDIVYLISDKDKSRARDRYIVVSIDFPWCFVKKFSGSQLRATSYKVKLSECYATSPSVIVADHSGPPASQDQDDEPSPVTPAVPAASVLPESPPPAPPELTSVPSDEEQFPSSTCDDTTVEAPIGVPSLPVLQGEPSTSATAPGQALPSCPSSSPETPGPRPQRQRKPPSYLNDYVRF
ncbi:unnamed protein product, partial [Porites lobata]